MNPIPPAPMTLSLLRLAQAVLDLLLEPSSRDDLRGTER